MTKGTKQPSKYVAKDSIGNQIRNGRPQFAKGAEVPDNHPQLEKWKEWGMVVENPARKISDEAKAAAEAVEDKPRQVPIFPIKRDVKDADYSLENAETARRRVEAESLESATREEMDEKQEQKDAEAAQAAGQPTVTKTTVTETVKPQVSHEKLHGKSNMDPEAVKEDKQDAVDAGGESGKAVKEAAKDAEETKKKQEEEEKPTAKKAAAAETEDDSDEDEDEDEGDEETPVAPKKATTAAKKTATKK